MHGVERERCFPDASHASGMKNPLSAGTVTPVYFVTSSPASVCIILISALKGVE